MISGMFGVEIVTSPVLTDYKQFRFPVSRKARIRKKWRKDTRRNWKHQPSGKIYQMGNKFICHPVTKEKLMRQLKARGEA